MGMADTQNVVVTIRKRVFNLSQAAFAEALGVTQATVSRWEAAGQFPDFDRAEQVRLEAERRGQTIPHEWFFTPPADEPEAA